MAKGKKKSIKGFTISPYFSFCKILFCFIMFIWYYRSQIRPEVENSTAKKSSNETNKKQTNEKQNNTKKKKNPRPHILTNSPEISVFKN